MPQTLAGRICAHRGWRGTVTGLCVALCVAAAGVCLCPPHRVAAYVACRSDPVLVVNGTVIDVVSTLYAAPSAIRELDYTVTVPAGAILGSTTLTVGLGFPERVTYRFSATQPWDSVRIAASVQTQPGVPPFTTMVQATSLLGSGTASGPSDTIVTLPLGSQIMI